MTQLMPDTKTPRLLESFSIENPTIHKPTRLYQLPIQNRQNTGIESLTGYIKRLAHAHCVSPNMLLRTEFIPRLSMKYASKSPSFFQTGAHSINSLTEIARRFSSLTFQLTKQSYIMRSTMLPWRFVLASSAHGLMRDHLAWCPECFTYLLNKGIEIYEPLYWAIELVEVCPIHRKILEKHCPNCAKMQPIISSKAKIGYCHYCFSWLGNRPLPDMFNIEDGDISHHISYHIWRMLLVPEVYFRDSVRFPQQSDFISGIQKLINLYSEGNTKLFANKFVPIDYFTLRQWLRARNKPSLELLISFCVCTGNDIVKMSKGEIKVYTYLTRLRDEYLQHFKKNVVKNNASLFAKSNDYINHLLLEPPDTPPSVAALARELDTSKGYLQNKFPDQCKELSRRYMKYAETQAQNHNKVLSLKTKNAVIEIYRNGKFPTQLRVSTLIGGKAYFKNQTVRDAYQETLSELGLNN